VRSCLEDRHGVDWDNTSALVKFKLWRVAPELFPIVRVSRQQPGTMSHGLYVRLAPHPSLLHPRTLCLLTPLFRNV